MKPGLTISCIGHACALIVGIVTISAQPMQSPPVDWLPVSFISDKDFTQLTQGVKNAPKLPDAHVIPLADKVDAPKPAEQLADKVANKPEITTESSTAKPKPAPKPADKAEKPKPPDYKPDQIADLLKKDDAKKPPKPDDKPNPDQPSRDAPKFNADQVAALLDHRDPRRDVATADQVNSSANLGVATGAQDAQLSQSEIDAFRQRVSGCWNPPAGVDVNSSLYVDLRILLKPDGSLVQKPIIVAGSATALGPALAESAVRALLVCQPFTMFKPEHYDQWKDMQIRFNPHELLGG
jgi:hypothetical protein